ncbi:MFS transporter [Henriciella aquimarina]|uniref:MFS transporter n=1 Tax=Henriciella aquimarina TaxID=545261 RepID=UPI001F19DD7D|nr:MFS transporter [Henriciella aquimarina]
MPYSAPVEETSSDWRVTLGLYRNVLAIVSALTVLQGATAALSVMIALSLQAAGASNAALGLVAACYAGGFLTGAIASPKQITRIGHIRSFSFFAALAIIATLSFSLGVNIIGWAVLQAVIGASTSALLTAGDGWITDSAPANRRGAILGFYHVVSKLGAIAGPFAIVAGANGPMGFVMVAALFALTIMPISATRKAQPEISTGTPFGPTKILKYAPAAAFAALCAGAVNNAVAQLYPVYAQSIMPDGAAGFSANFNAALLAGAMVGLWPAGMISDRVDRRMVIAGTGILAAGAALALSLFSHVVSPALILVLAFVYGVGALAYYAVAVAHAADRARPDQATSMMAGILVIWGIGSILGPLVAGVVMSSPLGAPGLFAFASASLALLAATMFTRTVNKAPVPEAEKEPFNATQTTSLALSELDPRGDHTNEQFDLFLAWMASAEADE